jgi:predicted acetyltransferase
MDGGEKLTWEIRPLEDESELVAYAQVQLSAYPSINGPLEAFLQRLQPLYAEDDAGRLYGVFEGHRLLAGMRLLDFQMNYCGRLIPAGGIGSVAVDLTEKKRGLAKAIVQYFIARYQRQGAHITLLYPFRPDFYQKMGYGFATKMKQYCFSPASLPCHSRQHGVSYLTEDDLPELRRFADEYAAKQHGFCRRSEFELRRLLGSHLANRTLVGWKQDGRLRAYIAFSFRRESNFLKNSLLIREWLWDGVEAFQACCAFLHTQADQFCQIIYNTTDEHFHFALADVRNGSDHIIPSVYHESNGAGVGLMYRITGLREFFAATNYRNYNGQTLDLRLVVNDSFCPDNAGTYFLRFSAGHLRLMPELEQGIELTMDISDLSALIMGSVSLQSLYRLGRAQIAAEYVSAVNEIWRMEQSPHCITTF